MSLIWTPSRGQAERLGCEVQLLGGGMGDQRRHFNVV